MRQRKACHGWHAFLVEKPITRMSYKALTILQYILNVSSATCFWMTNGICATAIFIFIHHRNGKNNQTAELTKWDKFGTSSGQVRDKLHTDNNCIKR